MRPLFRNTHNTDLHRQNHLNQFVSVALRYSSFRSRGLHRNEDDPVGSHSISNNADSPLAHVAATDLDGDDASGILSTTCVGVSNFG
jgi:hypothetical protein